MAFSPHPEAGRRLGNKYEILELAGVGGMAEVFRGMTHGASGFTRPVAIKRILSSLSNNTNFVDMFVEEARVVSELQHPNIVQIHDFDRDADGSYFLIMEWIEGMNFYDWCRAYQSFQETTPWHLVTAVGIEVLRALGAAHERRDRHGNTVPIYHRDVTPQNVLMTNTGILKLADFGLARAMDRSRMTRPDVVKGKLSYLAPELTSGADPSVRTDIFGIGICLWEALAGRKLFFGDAPLEVLNKVREAKVPSIGRIRPDIPEALHNAVHRALARDPQDRFRSSRSMVRALANILRMTPESTNADVLAKSVIASKARLMAAALGDGEVLGPDDIGEETQMLDLADLTPLDEPSTDGHIPLTRKKS